MSDGRGWAYMNGASHPPGGHKHIMPGNISRRWEWPSVWHYADDHERGELPHTHENPHKPNESMIIFTDGISI